MKMFKVFLRHIFITVILTLVYSVFLIVFCMHYASFTEDKMYEAINMYDEDNIHHICSIVGCNSIYTNTNNYTNKKLYQDIAPELLRLNNSSIREDLSLIVPLVSEKINNKQYIYFSVDTSPFYDLFLVLYFVLLVVFNVLIYIILKTNIKKEKLLHEIESTKDKTTLQYENLMFFIENLNHEVNTPMFILSRKLKDIKLKIERLCSVTECDTPSITQSFKIISDSIEQINAVMQRTREVKRINKVSDDRTISDLIESTILIVKVMRAEDFSWEIDEELEKYFLDQELIGNGTFINILTNHVKNSLEAFSTRFTVLFVSQTKDLLTLDFKDDGNGIKDIHKKQVFNKGFTTKGEKDERGCGLSINKNILEMCGGNIELIDTDVGATFRITIPIKFY